MEQCDRIFQIRIFVTTMSLFMPLIMPIHGLALETCDSPCEDEPYTKAAYLLEPASPTRVRPSQHPSHPLVLRTLRGPSVWSDAGSSPILHNLDAISANPNGYFQMVSDVLIQRSQGISLASLSELNLPANTLDQSRVLIAAPQNSQ